METDESTKAPDIFITTGTPVKVNDYAHLDHGAYSTIQDVTVYKFPEHEITYHEVPARFGKNTDYTYSVTHFGYWLDKMTEKVEKDKPDTDAFKEYLNNLPHNLIHIDPHNLIIYASSIQIKKSRNKIYLVTKYGCIKYTFKNATIARRAWKEFKAFLNLPKVVNRLHTNFTIGVLRKIARNSISGAVLQVGKGPQLTIPPHIDMDMPTPIPPL